jgi:ubiquinone/menaquinone biosynthesis C-methylase UbiE
MDDTDDPGFFVRFLDASRVRALAFARSNPELAFAHLALKPGLSVLDCGCGTGDMLALIARQVAPGAVCGGDLSSTMLAEARTRAAAMELANLRFESIDVQALPFADGSFDRVLATQLIVHVPDPRGALRQLCRVTAPKGLVAIADMDWDTLVLGSADKELGRRFTRLFSDGVRNGLVVREYAGWLRDEGFANIRTLPQSMVFDDWNFVRDWILAPALRHFVAVGTVSAAEETSLAENLAVRNAGGRFLGAATFYTVTAERP